MKPSTLSGQGIRFLIGGGLNTLFSYIIYWALLPLLPYTAAYTISYISAIFSGFSINTYFVFKSSWSWPRFFAFPIIHGFNYFASILIIWTSVEFIGISQKLSPIIATIIVLPLNFMLTKALIEKK
ncbi:polysaccharide synthesis protein GtrA [Lysobacteraceae bacterium NML07-0707]|nr:polysaccharide synthesis protein GtrA [Xanthomonadaceae bacterium NML07-0707]